jgi:hypothetical protein
MGLDRAAGVAASLGACDATGSPLHMRLLLRAMLLARLGERYPEGPAPRADLEPLLRSRRPEHEQTMRHGLVLSPLAVHGGEGLAWDVNEQRVMRVTDASKIGDEALLARSASMDVGRPTPLARLGRVKPGPPAASCDRRMLRCAERSFARVGRALGEELGDPFPRDAAPLLVGPFTYVKRTGEAGLWSMVEDGHGLRANLLYTGRALEAAGPGPLWALARPLGRMGQLALVPHLLWLKGRRVACTPAPVKSAPWEDGVVHELADLMGRVLAGGLEGNFASRAQIRALAPRVASAGFPRLARMAHDAVAPGRESDPLRFAAASHMTQALLLGPRWLGEGEAA